MQLWELAGVSVGIAIIASVADWRRQRRSDLDKVGFMPWTLITVMAVLAALVLFSVALRPGQ